MQSSVTGPDGRAYRVDSFMTWYCAVGTLRTAAYNGTTYTTAAPACTDTSTPPVEQSRPAQAGDDRRPRRATTSKTYVRETSTFDQAT